MEILLLLTSVFGLTGGVHAFNRALIKAIDDLVSDFGLEITVFSLLDGEVPFQAAADYMSSGHTRYRGFKGNKTEFAAATLLAGWRANRLVFGHVNFSSLACWMSKPIKSLLVQGIDVWRPLSSLQKFGISQMREILPLANIRKRHSSFSMECRRQSFADCPILWARFIREWRIKFVLRRSWAFSYDARRTRLVSAGTARESTWSFNLCPQSQVRSSSRPLPGVY